MNSRANLISITTANEDIALKEAVTTTRADEGINFWIGGRYQPKLTQPKLTFEFNSTPSFHLFDEDNDYIQWSWSWLDGSVWDYTNWGDYN